MTAKPDFTDCYIDLAQPRLGAEVISASDDFFAPKERLIQRVLIDTAFFKGNYPARGSLHGAMLEDIPDGEISTHAAYWKELLPPQKLGPDRVHVFEEKILEVGAVSHVRFDIYPDGGISRLRLFGAPTRD